MEEEVRVILHDTLAAEPAPPPPPNLVTLIRGRLDQAGGGVDLKIPPRAPVRKPPTFS